MRSSGTHRIVMLLCALLTLLGGYPANGGQGATNLVLVVDDQFDGTSLDTDLWSTCHWWAPKGCTIASNNELEWYLAEQVRVRDGQLRLTAAKAAKRQVPHSLPYVSGMVTTGPQTSDGPAKFAFTYGRVEVTFNAPSGTGLWPAIWMLPASTESRPEIDLYEAKAQRPEEWYFHLHPEARTKKSKRKEVADETLGSGSHTIGLDWQPSQLTWSVDGQPVWTVTGKDVPSEAMYLVINLAVGGVFPGSPDSSTPFPATFGIDRVRIWQAGAGFRLPSAITHSVNDSTPSKGRTVKFTGKATFQSASGAKKPLAGKTVSLEFMAKGRTSYTTVTTTTTTSTGAYTLRTKAGKDGYYRIVYSGNGSVAGRRSKPKYINVHQ